MPNTGGSNLSESSASEVSQPCLLSASLKFIVSNINKIVQNQLTQENYLVWRSQILNIFRANAFDHFLDLSIPPPPQTISHSDGSTHPNNLFQQWHLTDQNLAASLCSTISSAILPYVVNLESTADIWNLLQNHFQATNRSKVIQLKNTLHNISLKNMTMSQYLSEIKNLVDQIAASGSVVDNEDIILYIINGLPSSYQSFKTSIRTMLTPISLDNLYPLLLSEEINIISDATRNIPATDSNLALYAYRGRGRRNKGKSTSGSGQSSRQSASTVITCQICLKRGHSASDCWHRLNATYVPNAPNSANRALVAAPDHSTNTWFLDSGATSHLTHSMENLSIATPYQGSDGISGFYDKGSEDSKFFFADLALRDCILSQQQNQTPHPKLYPPLPHRLPAGITGSAIPIKG
ncbi:hypothetical protein KFK09_007475 [Dendrobium nobile]|uniref:Retrovirus-related Pol polyprotein from transposon TNT 1-94 n=1 Tax=Dendrobium nobile TaxID=94219 RepID=A0A8T3BU73_DENNO|nr:hypothetical protein KFK09_007475 [Dendrobium nobile]